MPLMKGQMRAGIMRGGIMASQQGETVYAYNVTKSNTAIARSRFNQLLAGTADMVIDYEGDSQTAGKGSDSAGGEGRRSQSPVAKISALLQTRLGSGITVSDAGFYGSNGKGFAGYLTYMEGQITQGSATIHATNFGPGGKLFNHALTTGALRWVFPGGAKDFIRFLVKGNTNGRAIRWTTDQGQTGTIPGTGTFVLEIGSPIALAPAATYIDIRSEAANVIEFLGAEVWSNDGKRKLFVRNLGYGGSSTLDWSSPSIDGGTRPRDSMPLMGAHLTGICLGTNDFTDPGPISVSDTYNNLVAQINMLKSANSDVFLIQPNPLRVAEYGSEAVQKPRRDAIKAAAMDTNIPYLDLKAAMGDTWIAANASLLMSDEAHMLEAGNAVRAALEDDFYRVLLAAA